MKVWEQEEKRNDEECIEAPTEEPGATRAREVVKNQHNHDQETRPELQKLEIRHHLLPFGADSEAAQQVVGVHYDMHHAIGDHHHRERRLSTVQAHVTHYHYHRVMVHVEKRQSFHGVTQDNQKRIHEFDNLGQVKNIGPEKERSGRWSPLREADEGVEVRDLGEDWNEATDGHDEREGEEEDVVEGRDWFEEWTWKGIRARELGENEGEGNVWQDGESNEAMGRGGCLASVPWKLLDFGMVH